jgi:hypothetical protein
MRRARFRLRLLIIQRVAHLFNAELLRKLLEFTVLAAQAGKAIHPVVAQGQLQGITPRLRDGFGVCKHLHAFPGGIDARRKQVSGTFNLYNTDAASADGVDFFHVAKGRYLYPGNTGGFEDC